MLWGEERKTRMFLNEFLDEEEYVEMLDDPYEDPRQTREWRKEVDPEGMKAMIEEEQLLKEIEDGYYDLDSDFYQDSDGHMIPRELFAEERNKYASEEEWLLAGY